MQLGDGKIGGYLIGPEGDFSQEELDDALSKGFLGVSLGKNRLRSETAASPFFLAWSKISLCINDFDYFCFVEGLNELEGVVGIFIETLPEIVYRFVELYRSGLVTSAWY